MQKGLVLPSGCHVASAVLMAAVASDAAESLQPMRKVLLNADQKSRCCRHSTEQGGLRGPQPRLTPGGAPEQEGLCLVPAAHPPGTVQPDTKVG